MDNAGHISTVVDVDVAIGCTAAAVVVVGAQVFGFRRQPVKPAGEKQKRSRGGMY